MEVDFESIWNDLCRRRVTNAKFGEDLFYFFGNLPVCAIKSSNNHYYVWLLKPYQLEHLGNSQDFQEAQRIAISNTIHFGLEFELE